MKKNIIRNPHELFFRSRQILWNQIDFFKFFLGKYDEFFDHDIFRGWQGQYFPLSIFRSQNIDRDFNACFPGIKSNILSHADKVCQHFFDILGYRNLDFRQGDQVNWYSDPIHNKFASTKWWQKVDPFDFQSFGDPKIIWEINRHQHFLVLARAFRISGVEQYREEFGEQILSWITHNSPKRGINWTSSLEMAYRGISWIWAWQLMDGSKFFPKEVQFRILNALYIQALHIENNLSTYFSPNTHLTGEALGLVFMGHFFAGVNAADRWVEKGTKILLNSLEKHVLSDGGYMERSLWYHRYTIDIYIHFLVVSNAYGRHIPEIVFRTIEKSAEFLMYAIRPDRCVPFIGDDDGGRLLVLDTLEGDDLRGLFSTLSVIFKRGDFKFISESYQEETFWILGPESKEAYADITPSEPHSKSAGFPETGFFFMRSNWSQTANYISFCCGEHGWLNCGHAHADLLSFSLCAHSKSIIVDPGTFTYHGELRNFFRGHRNHCTIEVDGYYPAQPSGRFQWKEIPEHQFLGWHSSEISDYVAGKLISGRGWEHMREIVFLKPDFILIIDSLIGSGRHMIKFRFPLGDIEWTFSRGRWVHKETNSQFSIENFSNGAFNGSVTETWYAPSFGIKKKTGMLIFEGEENFPVKAFFFINLSNRIYTPLIKDKCNAYDIKLSSDDRPLLNFKVQRQGVMTCVESQE